MKTLSKDTKRVALSRKRARIIRMQDAAKANIEEGDSIIPMANWETKVEHIVKSVEGIKVRCYCGTNTTNYELSDRSTTLNRDVKKCNVCTRKYQQAHIKIYT